MNEFHSTIINVSDCDDDEVDDNLIWDIQEFRWHVKAIDVSFFFLIDT